MKSNSQLSDPDFEFTTLDRILFTQIFVESFECDLAQIKQSLNKSKSAYFTTKGVSLQKYKDKKKLVQKYVKCANSNEKELLQVQLVSLLYILFLLNILNSKKKNVQVVFI